MSKASSKSLRTTSQDLEPRRKRSCTPHSDAYFAALDAFHEAMATRRYPDAATQALIGIEHLAGFIQESKKQDKAAGMDFFMPPIVPAIDSGGQIFALLDDKASLKRLEQVIRGARELQDCRSAPAEFEHARKRFRALERLVEQQPGIRQDKVKASFAAESGRVLSTALDWLEKAGRIIRKREGRTWTLHPRKAAAPAPATTPASHRQGGVIQALRVAWADTSISAFPRSPKWHEVAPTQGIQEPFRVSGKGWRVLESRPVPKEAQWPAAFKYSARWSGGSVHWNAPRQPDAERPAGLIFCSLKGERHTHKELPFGIIRCAPLLRSGHLAIFSHRSTLHVFDPAGAPVFETDQASAPETKAQARRLKIQPSELHRFHRCFTLHPQLQSYLITIADEAWCIRMDGTVLWGVRLPLLKRDDFILSFDEGSEDDVLHSLEVLGLSYPFTPEEAKRRYRQLARQWHPDVNSTAEATVKMQQINQAMQLVAGLEETGQPPFKEIEDASMLDPDWVYAAAFSQDGERVFIATTSGKILELDEKGRSLRVFDVGANVFQLAHDEGRLFIRTATRLYIVRDGALEALADTGQTDEVLPLRDGCVLLGRHQLRQLDAQGRLLGSIDSREMILNAWHDGTTLHVETQRQHLAVTGASPWR